jgi:hypothetical protein
LKFAKLVIEPINYDSEQRTFAVGDPSLRPLGDTAQALLNANAKVVRNLGLRKNHVNAFRYVNAFMIIVKKVSFITFMPR